jgi:protein-glutamine gamma-glutamyltransferase
MTPPLGLLSCTLLFWGWQSHLLPFAIPMAFILEGARWVNWRWALSNKDFNRVTDLTSFSFILATLYLVIQESLHGLTTLLNWLPILLFLLIAAQIYSTQGAIKMSSLFWSLRRFETKTGASHPYSSLQINLSYPYLMICLLSASVGYHPWFFVGACLLIAYALWTIRPQRYSVRLWTGLLFITVTLAYIGQLGLYRLQIEVESIILNWFEQMLWADRDPYRQYTAIGDIGRLKQSQTIRLRVETDFPLLLREASYHLYFNSLWRNKNVPFTELFPNSTEISQRESLKWASHRFQFAPVNGHALGELDSQISVSAYMPQGKRMLALPHGTYQISKLPVPSVLYNDFGAVKVENGPGLIKYTAHFNEKNTPLDSLPSEYDLHLPGNEKKHLMALSTHLGLPQQGPLEVLKTLTSFFNDFQYDLTLSTPKQGEITPLEHFLQHSRTGHCEYFASATVLLLRTAGIPSRYASGYAVEEYSDLEKVYIVRQRHAHAWALAYINEGWQIVDNTPIDWIRLEEEQAAWWKSIYDLGSFFAYLFYKWRWENRQTSNQWLLWLILPLGMILIWRLYTRQKINRSQKASVENRIQVEKVGGDSPFYHIVAQLNAAGYICQPGETLSIFLKRLPPSVLPENEKYTLLNLHQRYRFDPKGISSQEEAQFRADVMQCLINLR